MNAVVCNPGAAWVRPRLQDRLTSQSLRMLMYASQAVADLVAIMIGFVLAHLAYNGFYSPSSDALQAVAVAALYGIVALYAGAYSMQALLSFQVSVLRATKSLAFALAGILLVAFTIKASADLSRVIFLSGAALAFSLILAARFAISWHVKNNLSGSIVSNVFIRDGVAIATPAGYHVLDAQRAGIVPNSDDPVMLHLIGTMLQGADRVVVACAPEARQMWANALKGSNLHAGLIVPELQEIDPISSMRVGSSPVVQVSCGPLDMRSRILKRTLDLMLTVPALIVLAPLLLLVALAIKLESPGPVFFVQERMGRGNRLFHTWKFRSMRADLCDSNGSRSAARDDDRVTRVGRLIRATSIDELPQLFNVILGDMSLVGPRPHALGSLAGDQLFWQVDSRYWHRHACKPGITGLAQVRGFRGATHQSSDLSKRLQADLEYVAGWSIWRDCAILVATLGVIKHKNAF